MKKLFKYVVYLFPLMMGIYIFVFFYLKLPNHLHYQEQFQLFLFTNDYFREVCSFPGGFSNYIGRFLTQFYFNGLLGPLIIAASLILIQQLFQRILFRFSEKVAWSPLSFIPVVFYWYLLCDGDMYINGVGALFLCFLFLLIGLHIRNITVRRISYPVVILLLYWLAGGVITLFIAIALLYEWLIVKESKKSLSIITVLSLLLVVACPFMAKSFIIQYPFYRFFFGTDYGRFVGIIPTYIVILWLVIVVIVAIYRYLPAIRKQRNELIIYSVNALIIILSSVYFINIKANSLEKWKEELMGYDHYTRMEQWDKVIEMANRKAPDIPMTVACLNLALSKTNQLPDQMFQYFQNGTDGLLVPFQRDYMIATVAGESYYYLGFINTAQRFAFEAQEALPDYQKSVRSMVRLVETNIINGNYETAARYIGYLENTWFYKSWALNAKGYLYQEEKINEDPEWGKLRSIRTKEDFIFSSQEIDMMLGLMFQQSPKNKMAFEYLLAYLLLSKDLSNFVSYYQMKKDFEYKSIPKSYQEALIYLWSLQSKDLSNVPFPISDSIIRQLTDYANIYTTQQNAEPVLKKRFGNTYWYYFHFGRNRQSQSAVQYQY